MNKELKNLCDELTEEIKKSYEESITVPEAERLAGRFLHAQLVLASAIRNADLDYRMKKSGTKALRAATYLDAATSVDKKPSDSVLNNMVEDSDLVKASQKEQDTAEVDVDELRNFFDIFHEAHIHFRGIAKGSM